jgi:hypothetical protein
MGATTRSQGVQHLGEIFEVKWVAVSCNRRQNNNKEELNNNKETTWQLEILQIELGDVFHPWSLGEQLLTQEKIM